MKTNELTILAWDVAFKAHHGQFRRDGKTPYHNHLMQVAMRVPRDDYEAIATAFLHDVLEDTNVTAEQLADAGIPLEIIANVAILSKDKDESYAEYIRTIKENPLARKVKIADMLANLSDNPTDKQILKYSKALIFLLE